jgi:P2 family phage contractile tail tube protein
MSKNPEMVIHYDIYEDAVNMLGSAEVTLPEIANKTQTITGAGIAGEIEAVALGHIGAMSMSIKWRAVTNDVVRLYEQRRHNLELRVAQQSHDSTSAKISITPAKYVVGVVPKKLGPGTLAPASPANAASDFSVLYLAGYIEGVKVLEIDPINYIFYVNGTDYLANVRSALGR